MTETETIILLTGDTDLAPAIHTCKRLFPNKYIFFAFPYKRTNVELKNIAPESFSIKSKSYFAHQFSDPFSIQNGPEIYKPLKWAVETALWKIKPFFSRLSLESSFFDEETPSPSIYFEFFHNKTAFSGKAEKDKTGLSIKEIKEIIV